MLCQDSTSNLGLTYNCLARDSAVEGATYEIPLEDPFENNDAWQMKEMPNSVGPTGFSL